MDVLSLDDDRDASVSDHYRSHPDPSRQHISWEEKRIDLEMLKEKNWNLELKQAIKRARTLSVPDEPSTSKRQRWIKRPKKDEIYHSTDYANFRSFCDYVENFFE